MKRLLFCLALLTGLAQAQSWVTVSGSNIWDATQQRLTGQICFQPTNGTGPISFRAVPGQVISRAICAPVTSGTFSVTLPNTTTASPTNPCFNVYVRDSATNQVVLGSMAANNTAGYQCLQTGAGSSWCGLSAGVITCDFDNYVPNLPNLPIGQTVTGPQGPAGVGVPAGGSVGQVLLKSGAGDYVTAWQPVAPSSATVIGSSPSGQLIDNTASMSIAQWNANQINSSGVPVSKTIIGTNSSGQLVDATASMSIAQWNANQINSSGVPVSKTIIGTNSSGQLVDATASMSVAQWNASQINSSGVPGSKTIIGTNSSGQIVDAGSATLANNTTGSAAKWTAARNLAGNSVDGSANVTFANKFIVQGTADSGLSGAQFLGSLGTGLVKNTTSTGVLSIAASSDVTTALGFTPENAANKGLANGYASLDGGGRVPLAQIPPVLIAGMQFQGTWNPVTNSPALASGVGTDGYIYEVSTACTVGGSPVCGVTLDGSNTWIAGDIAAFDGTHWQRITAYGQYATLFSVGSNVAFGQGALAVNSGSRNVALGQYALQSNTTGSVNTAVGPSALVTNTTGTANTGVGVNALCYSTSGGYNTAVGANALASNTTGSTNTGIGYQALFSNTTGNTNNALGDGALLNTSTGGGNTAVGQTALASIVGGNNNVGVGNTAGFSANVNGADSDNTWIGNGTGPMNGAGVINNSTALGFGAFVNASNQVAIGSSAVTDVYLGQDNAASATATIHAAGYKIGNTALASTNLSDSSSLVYTSRTVAGKALSSNITLASTDLSDTTNIARLNAANAFTNTGSTTFAGNVGIGANATSPGYPLTVSVNANNYTELAHLSNTTAGANSAAILQFGNDATYGQVGLVSSLWTANSAIPGNYMYMHGPYGLEFFTDYGNVLLRGNNMGISTLAASTSNTLCYNTSTISGYNTLSTCSSLRKYKAGIRPLLPSLAEVMKLRPVSYTSKTNGRKEIGFVAEDVELLDRRLSTYDKEGQLAGVQYGHMAALLTKAIQEQQREIDQLKKQLRSLEAK